MTDFEKVGERMRMDRMERRIQDLEETVRQLRRRIESLENVPHLERGDV